MSISIKKKRLAEISEIIRTSEIENQDELMSELSARGYTVTQATVSRDMNELRIEKRMSRSGRNCYVFAGEATAAYKMRSLFSSAVINISFAGNIVAVKCYAGLANAACAAVDTIKFPEIVGTLAGDDTIFILTKNESAAEELREKLLEL
ncbi:arginine repressor [Clostridia bacterium]|nr:arginine repressor [Clostridia bacterium]